jgi:hypothetical protein
MKLNPWRYRDHEYVFSKDDAEKLWKSLWMHQMDHYLTERDHQILKGVLERVDPRDVKGMERVARALDLATVSVSAISARR